MPGLTHIPVFDRDEAHFAQATRQMIQNDNYYQIRFQDVTRFQKPPGINWFQALAVKVFSSADDNTIWPYRLASLLGALLSVLGTYLFARRFFSDQAAFYGAAFLASSLLLVFESHMAVIDAMLLLSVVLMQGSLWIVYNEEKCHWVWVLCFWLSLTLGLVLKGVTPLVAVLTIVTLALVDRDLRFLKRLHPFKGLILFAGLTLIWVLGVNQAENSNYLMQMINKDLMPKLQGGHESHGQFPLFHLVILPITFWPISLFLWQVVVYGWSSRQQKNIRFLLSWLIPTWIFFELMPTKLPQYVLPTFPALALILAVSFEHINGVPNRLVRVLQILWGVLSVGIGVGIAILSYFLLQQIDWVSIGLALVIAVLSLSGVFYAWHGQPKRAITALLLMALATYPVVFGSILPRLTPLWISHNLVQQLDKSQISAENPLLVVGYEEPSLVFELNTKWVQFSNYQHVRSILKNDPQRIFVMSEEEFKALPQAQQNELSIKKQIKGFNYSKGKWITLYALSM